MPTAVSTLTVGKAKIDRIEFTAEEIDRLKAKLLALTEAKVIVRSPVRDENGRCKYVEVPDTGIQLAATVKAIEFGVGKPRQMMELTTSNGSAMPEKQNLAKLLMANPDLVASVLATMKGALENSQAIPVQAVKSENPGSLPESQSECPKR